MPPARPPAWSTASSRKCLPWPCAVVWWRVSCRSLHGLRKRIAASKGRAWASPPPGVARSDKRDQPAATKSKSFLARPACSASVPVAWCGVAAPNPPARARASARMLRRKVARRHVRAMRRFQQKKPCTAALFCEQRTPDNPAVQKPHVSGSAGARPQTKQTRTRVEPLLRCPRSRFALALVCVVPRLLRRSNAQGLG